MKIVALLLTVGMVAVLAILIAMRIQRGVTGGAHFVRRRVLDAPEQVLHHRLRLALTPQYQVLAHVNVAEFIAVEGGNEAERLMLRAKTRRRCANFLVCDHGYLPLCVIELHDEWRENDHERVWASMVGKAGIGLLRYNVQAMPKPEQIRSDFSRARSQGARLEICGGSAGSAPTSGPATV